MTIKKNSKIHGHSRAFAFIIIFSEIHGHCASHPFGTPIRSRPRFASSRAFSFAKHLINNFRFSFAWRGPFVSCPYVVLNSYLSTLNFPPPLVGAYWEHIGRILGEVLPEVATDGLYKSGQLALVIPTFGHQIGHKVPSKWGRWWKIATLICAPSAGKSIKNRGVMHDFEA